MHAILYTMQQSENERTKAVLSEMPGYLLAIEAYWIWQRKCLLYVYVYIERRMQQYGIAADPFGEM